MIHIVSIGRAPENTIAIQDALVSGKHALIVRENDHYFVEDLHSTNGTLVDGVLLRSGRQVITPNTVIKVGETVVMWQNHFTQLPPTLPEPPKEAITLPEPDKVLPALPTQRYNIAYWLFWTAIGTSGFIIFLLLLWYFRYIQRP
jgi:pSer/pThr/pTyr-binding forkhead associated (FHA) protein